MNMLVHEYELFVMKKDENISEMSTRFTWGLVLLKDLPKTTNTVWYFYAQIKIMKYG